MDAKFEVGELDDMLAGLRNLVHVLVNKMFEDGQNPVSISLPFGTITITDEQKPISPILVNSESEPE